MITLSIPKQYEGAQSDNSFCIKAHSIANAQMAFIKAKKNLLNVNRWNKLAGALSAKFQLTDGKGDALYRPAKENDYIKIKLPLPDKQYDWVRIEAIHETDNEPHYQKIMMVVRPANNPQDNENIAAHFFTHDATSSFIVERKNEKIIATVHGRNELPNIDTNNIFYKIRNLLLALSAMLGLNTPQWKALAKGIVTKNNYFSF